MKQRHLSVQTKILAALAVVFVLLMLATTWHSVSNERAMAGELAEQKAGDLASSYFDGVNTMMLTGTMGQRDLLRAKYEAHADVTEVRQIRAPAVVQTFGPGGPEQDVRDALDRRALAGERVVDESRDATGRLVTVVTPIVASKDFRGTNCLTCHQVAEGTVLGATRVSYSLARLDQKIRHNLIEASVINLGLLILAMAAITWLLRRIVVQPLSRIRGTMQHIEREADLRERIDIASRDEIGEVCRAFNGMLEHFGASLGQVSDTAAQLNSAADQIAEVARQTAAAAAQQRGETDTAATAINELEATALQVRGSACSAADASVEADQAAAEGAQTTGDAITGIHELTREMERAAEVIERLDERSRSVGAVLDVIKGIAEQTNLLALNAAIEAARAGETGRGFAVVADEVRTLANRSHESTREIETIVEQLQLGARDAVTAMAQAKNSAERRRSQVESAVTGLSLIAERVGHIRELNAQMAVAAEEQSVVTQDVGRNVVNISQLAERTTHDAAQTTEASRDLVQLAERLQQLVHRFRF